MGEEVFPFTLYADRVKGWSDYDFRKDFMKVRPRDLVWYGYDVIIESVTQVTFIAYDMRDMCHGGLGDKIAEFPATVDKTITSACIERRIWCMAERARDHELAATELLKITEHAERIRAANGLEEQK